MTPSLRLALASVVLATPLFVSAAPIVIAEVSSCGQFGRVTSFSFCPTGSFGTYGGSAFNSAPTGASAVHRADHDGYPGARTSHSGAATAVQGVVRMSSDTVMNAAFEYPNRLAGWTTSTGRWAERVSNQVVAAIDLPFQIDGAFDWDASGPISGGYSPGVVSVRGQLSVYASLTPLSGGGPLVFDEETFDITDPRTLFDELVTLHLRGMQPGTDYQFHIGMSFQTLILTGGCPAAALDGCLTRASASADFMNTGRLLAATFYDVNGQAIQGGLTSESGYDYQRDAVVPGGGPGTVPVPATWSLLALGLILLARRRGTPSPA